MIELFALLSAIPLYNCIRSTLRKSGNLIELILLLSLYFTGLWFLYHGLALPDYGESTSPGTVPVVLAILLCILTLMQSVAAVGKDVENLSANKATPFPFIILTLASTGYLLLLPLTGYYPATAAFLLFVLFVAKERLMRSLFLTIVWLVAVYFLFERVLGISMPEGQWISRWN